MVLWLNVANTVLGVSSAIALCLPVKYFSCLTSHLSTTQNSHLHFLNTSLFRKQIWNRDSLLLCVCLLPHKYHTWSSSQAWKLWQVLKFFETDKADSRLIQHPNANVTWLLQRYRLQSKELEKQKWRRERQFLSDTLKLFFFYWYILFHKKEGKILCKFNVNQISLLELLPVVFMCVCLCAHAF